MLRRGLGDGRGDSARPSSPGSYGVEPSQAEDCSQTYHSSTERIACQQSMATLISDEIIPRLVAAHRHGKEDKSAAVVHASPLDPAYVADMAVARDAGELADLLAAALEAGMEYESLLLDLLAPAARILGERWEDDRADFVEVTLGLWRLQEVVHELASRYQGTGECPQRNTERRILCAVAPGDDHSFGSLMLEDLFRRGGWSTAGVRGASRSELVASVRNCWFDIIALTVSIERDGMVLARLVADLRAASRNPGVSVMVGGLVFTEQPDLADKVGADATAADARAALQKAELLVGQLQVAQSDGAAHGAAYQGFRVQRVRARAGPG